MGVVAMFRINTNILAITGNRSLFKTSNDMSKAMQRLSTGLRIVHAQDDAAGLSMSEGMRGQIAAAKQSNRNISQAIAMLQTVDGGYEQIGNMLIRLKELATQAADSTLNGHNRSAIQAEVTQLLDEIERIAQSTTFNGMTLINTSGHGGAGASLAFQFYVGDGSLGAPTYQIITFGMEGVNYVTACGGVFIGGSQTGFVITPDSYGSLSEAANVVDVAQNAIISLASIRTSLGAVVNRLERAQANIQQMIENTANSESIIRDADFATETAALTRAQILVQAGTSLLQQANLLPQNSLLLLQG